MFKTFKIKIFIILFFVSSIALTTSFFIRHYLTHEINRYLEGKREDIVYLLIGEIEREYAKSQSFKNFDIKWLSDFERKLHLKIGLEDINNELIYPEKLENIPENSSEYPLFYKRNLIGNIKVSFEEEERIKVLMRRTREFLITSILISFLIILGLSIVISDRISKPIKELTKASHEVSKGNLNIEIKIDSRDEIGILGKAFSEMIKKLKMLDEIRRKNVSNLSHEMRTPLTVIKGNLIAILDGIIKNDEQTVKSLLEEVEKLEKITDGIKRLADIDSVLLQLNLEDVNLKEVTLNTINALTPLLLEKKLTIKTEIKDLVIKADKQLYSQLLLNLLTNAIKASKENNVIEVTIDDEKKVLIVKDFGIGIDSKDINLIFERFYKKFKDGSGVGLSIVRDIVTAHNWEIRVNSQTNFGTEFIVKFKNS